MLYWIMMLFEYRGCGLYRKSFYKSSLEFLSDNFYVKFGWIGYNVVRFLFRWIIEIEFFKIWRNIDKFGNILV